jgi:hypothetical protein
MKMLEERTVQTKRDDMGSCSDEEIVLAVSPESRYILNSEVGK